MSYFARTEITELSFALKAVSFLRDSNAGLVCWHARVVFGLLIQRGIEVSNQSPPAKCMSLIKNIIQVRSAVA